MRIAFEKHAVAGRRQAPVRDRDEKLTLQV
jgi:hypothetical protein